ncbi:hypothetical protein [Pseudomonas sp. R9.37]|uniref:hypothetical protein n=1 Tax=Pseudomonas sp. R9.37 TaxID=1390498 RepID=UPI000D0DAA78|nr:hypothetical protein [Pseudomonas sp. R9.37]PSL90789.1 hypothetical protein C7U57_28660 [Pseudomonas sp. R9.37]
MMTTSRRFWTTVELEKLKALYPNTPINDLVRLFDRSARSIYAKAKELRVKRSADYSASEHSGRFCKCQGCIESMAKTLTTEQMEARYEALREASQHLQMDWTNSAIERSEGLLMADWLSEQALKWLSKAHPQH